MNQVYEQPWTRSLGWIDWIGQLRVDVEEDLTEAMGHRESATQRCPGCGGGAYLFPPRLTNPLSDRVASGFVIQLQLLELLKIHRWWSRGIRGLPRTSDGLLHGFGPVAQRGARRRRLLVSTSSVKDPTKSCRALRWRSRWAVSLLNFYVLTIVRLIDGVIYAATKEDLDNTVAIHPTAGEGKLPFHD